MPVDLPATLTQATVQIEQAQPDGSHIVGTGFLINDPTPDGKPRTVLVTANHVFERMSQGEAHIGYRIQGKDGAWSYDPEPIAIRRGKTQLWTHHPSRDVAAAEKEVAERKKIARAGTGGWDCMGLGSMAARSGIARHLAAAPPLPSFTGEGRGEGRLATFLRQKGPHPRFADLLP